MNTIKKFRIRYETAAGREAPSLREVGEVGINSVDYGYDFVLRGEVEGWPSRNFTIGDYLLDELREDVRNAQ